ncbi:MAG: DUF1501 domain-containing protein, partial [Planctomycetales bacterium]|nr:DUF1501 domain-containing protein [Planctomycetales bacterium]
MDPVSQPSLSWNDCPRTRREFLSWSVRGIGATALWALLADEGRGEGRGASESVQRSHHPPLARRAIHICLVGGLSHLDSFDYKPELDRMHGKSLQTDEQPDIFFGQVGQLRRSDFRFQQRGKSGLWVSDLFPHLAELADELCVVRSMMSDSANHTPALFLANSGFQFNGFPSMGAWLSYGL